MVKIGQYSFPDDRKYLINKSPNHFWTKVEAGVVILGISSFLIMKIGKVFSLTFPKRSLVGKYVNYSQFLAPLKGLEYWKLLYHQLSGEICEINEDRVKCMNEPPYEDCWILKLKINETIEQQLLSENWITSDNLKFKEFIEFQDTHFVANPV